MRSIIYSSIIFTCIIFTSCILFRPSPKRLTYLALKAHASYDAVIVPGVPFKAPYWDRVMQMRVIWAVHLYKTGLAKNLIMSGSSVYTPFVEAKIMKLYAIQLGVPEDHIFTEEKAEHSTENIWYSSKLAASLHFQSVALATDPFQTKLLLRFGKRRVKDLKYLPVIFKTLKTLPQDTPTIAYENIRVPDFVALPDRQSKRERLRGTWGKHINFKE